MSEDGSSEPDRASLEFEPQSFERVEGGSVGGIRKVCGAVVDLCLVEIPESFVDLP